MVYELDHPNVLVFNCSTSRQHGAQQTASLVGTVGVAWSERANADAFLITLKKTETDYSPSSLSTFPSFRTTGIYLPSMSGGPIAPDADEKQCQPT